VLSGAAAFYEGLRYSVDYRESHLLRRHALERILRRRLELTGHRDDIGKLFLVELVQSGYLKNDSVPESIIPEVNDIIKKYLAIMNLVSQANLSNQQDVIDWWLGVASAELEEFLAPAEGYRALVDLMTTAVEKDKPLAAWNLDKDQETTLIYIAAYRALFAFDPSTLHELLLLRSLPQWRKLQAADMPQYFAELSHQRELINLSLQHPATERLWRLFKTRAIVFQALFDLTKKAGAEAENWLTNPDKVATEISAICQGYYKTARSRLYGSAARATLYVFLTKVIIAIGIEAPLERFIFGEVPSLPLAINLIIPPLLLISAALFTSFPGANNTKRCLELAGTVLWGGNRRIVPEARVIRRSIAMEQGLSVFYFLTFFITFGLIATGLSQIGFTWISTLLFLFFISVVSFFALRIRQPVRDLYVGRSSENIFTLLIDFFSLPILKVGRFISTTSARFNVFLFFFDYFLEVPFKSLLLLTEDVLGFFREKKEDIV
jgi:hypothetical protein